jgi:hypothetical protein
MVDEHDVVQVGTCIDSILARANASADGQRRDHVIRNYSWHQVAEAIAALDKTNE